MEHGFLLVCLVSAGAGFLLRRKVRPTLGRIFLALGLIALAGGVSIIGFLIRGWATYGVYTGGLVAVVLFGVAALALPFGLVASWGR